MLSPVKSNTERQRFPLASALIDLWNYPHSSRYRRFVGYAAMRALRKCGDVLELTVADKWSGADLSGTGFRGADLSGTGFRGADLSGTGFRGADLGK